MTRSRVLAIAATVLLALVLAGGSWAVARDDHDGRGPNGMMGGDYARGPAAHGMGFRGDGGMMGSGGYGGMMGYGGYGGYGGMMGGGMMGGTSFGIAGTGEVTTLDQAHAAAQRYADRLDLQVGEVMQFSNNFYAELVAASGAKATEVLIDPDSGSVRLEYGPAMMWNTRYGMHPWVSTSTVGVSAEEAQQIAGRWLAQYDNGTTAGDADVFPGYYTVHTLEGGEVTGMLSVNAYTGAVWYHSWHGDFVAMTE
jgi:hypothetical protein